MSTSMRASFTLTLEDKLSSGLKNIQDAIGRLRQAGNTLTLGKLDSAGDVLRTVAQEVRNLTSNLRGIEGAADRAWGALKRLATPLTNAGHNAAEWGRRTLGPQSRIGAFGAAAEGYSVYEPIQQFAEFENIARHSAITQGLSGPQAAAETQRLMSLFRTDALATGQTSTSIAQAFQDLIQTGIAPALAEKLLPIHSRAATAYNITPEALGHAVFALSDSFKIDETGMGGALAAMAMASKEGRFKVEDFSRYLPAIGGDMSKLGMTGRGSADMSFASMETVMKNAADPNTGAANFIRLMNDLTSPHSARAFALDTKGMAEPTKAMLAKYNITGIDLPKLLENARKGGVDPLTAVLGALQKKVAGLPPDVMAEVLGAFFGNQESRDAAQSLLSHRGELLDMLKRLHGANADLLGRDFATAFDAPLVQLRLTGEELSQLGQRAGEGFLPVMRLVTASLRLLLSGLDALDKRFPGLSKNVLGAVGGFLAFGAAVAAIGFVAPVVLTGLEMIASVIGAIAGSFLFPLAGFALLGYEIATNWDAVGPVFFRVGNAIGDALLRIGNVIHSGIIDALWAIGAAWDWIADTASRAWSWMVDRALSFPLVRAAIDGLSDAWDWIANAASGAWSWMVDRAVSFPLVRAAIDGLSEAWGGLKVAAQSVFDAMDSWTGGGLTTALHGIHDAVQSVIDALHALAKLMPTGGIGIGAPDPDTAKDNAGPGGAPTIPTETTPAVRLLIELAEGLGLKEKDVPPGVRVETAKPNPGRAVGVP